MLFAIGITPEIFIQKELLECPCEDASREIEFAIRQYGRKYIYLILTRIFHGI